MPRAPAQRPCKVVIRPAATAQKPCKVVIRPAATTQPAPKTKMSPEQYFAALRGARERALRDAPHEAALVDRSQVSILDRYCEVLRGDGVKLRVTTKFLACFYDLTQPAVIQVLCITERCLRRVKTWSGMTRWPRAEMLARTHAHLTLELVRKQRWKMMRWAYNHDPFIYGLLRRAHAMAGYSTDTCPEPKSGQPAQPAQPAPEPPCRVKAVARVRDEHLPRSAAPEPCRAEPEPCRAEPEPCPAEPEPCPAESEPEPEPEQEPRRAEPEPEPDWLGLDADPDFADWPDAPEDDTEFGRFLRVLNGLD